MTTIAEFLDRHKNYSLHKEAANVRTWNPFTWGNPSEKGVKSQIEAALPEGIQNFVGKDPNYQGLLPFLNEQNKQALIPQFRDIVYDYYRSNPNLNWPDPKNFKLPQPLEDKLVNATIAHIRSNLGQDNNLQALYQTALDNMTDVERAIVTRQAKKDPRLALQIGKLLAPHAEGLLDRGLEGLNDQDTLKQIAEKVSPDVYSAVLSSGLNTLDMLPNELIPKGMSEQEFLEQNLFGNDPRFKGALSKYYDTKNPYNSNQVVFGLLNEFQNPDSPLRLAAIDHYRHLPEVERRNSMLARWMNTMADFANDMGQITTRDQLDNAVSNLSQNMGTYGKGFLGNETIDSEFGKQVGNHWGTVQNILNNNNVGKKWLSNWNNYPVNEKAQQNWQDYANEIKNNRMQDYFYGALGDPSIQKVVQYAAPFVGYGAPLAMLGSMNGNNSLWPLVLLGGLGSAGFRYGAENGYFGMSPETLNNMDEWMGTINGPLGMVGSMLPTGLSAATNSALGVKDSPASTTTGTTEQKQEKLPPSNTSAQMRGMPPEPLKPSPYSPVNYFAQNKMQRNTGTMHNPYGIGDSTARDTSNYFASFGATGNQRLPKWRVNPYNSTGIRSQNLDTGSNYEFA